MPRILGRPLLALASALALGWGLAGSAVAAADRDPQQIVTELDNVEIPKLDPARKGDTQAMTEYLLRHKAALARRGALTLELFHAAPDHPRLPALFSDRWVNLLQGTADTARDSTLGAELAEVLGKTTNGTLKAHAAFYKTIFEIETGEGGPDEILKRVETFIQVAPRDVRGAMLLCSVAGELDDPARQAELYRRVIQGYPDTTYARTATTSLKTIESLGKPFALEFDDAITGAPVAMADFRGKVVVIDFWATWCGPCVREMPTMKDLYSKYHGQGVEFIGVSLDEPREEGGLDKLKAFVARNGIKWPQYYQGKGWASDFSSSWGISAIPALFVVDPDGNLFSLNARSRLEEILEQFLKKRTAGK